MLTLNFNPFPVLITTRLVLRQLQQEDVNELFFLRSDPTVLHYINKERAKTMEEVSAFIRKINLSISNNESVMWAITLRNDDKVTGNICFWNIEPENDRAEIGYTLHPSLHGQGIMHEALNKVISYGFNIMKLHSITAHVNPLNIPSIKLLEKNNFTREAYFKENYFYDGSYRDTAIYGLLSNVRKEEMEHG